MADGGQQSMADGALPEHAEHKDGRQQRGQAGQQQLCLMGYGRLTPPGQGMGQVHQAEQCSIMFVKSAHQLSAINMPKERNAG